MILYGFEFSVVELIFFWFFLLAFACQLYFYLRYIRGVLRLKNKVKNHKVVFQTNQPPVSVIICAKDEAENLRRYLPYVLEQNYPDFEVIVVNDGLSDETQHLIDDLKEIHQHLRTTFVPEDVTNLSTKKLALTLGIKAAKNDLLLFTDADCMPEDKSWITRMVRNFEPGVDFVLGYGAYLQKPGFVNKLITYDTLFNALQYMGFAIVGKPYMGVGRNMAYRKEMFNRQKGFASSLHLRSGDDDLMVNYAANKSNVKVEVSSRSITWSEPKKNFKAWYYQKERHLSVSSFYKPSSKFNLSLEPSCRGLFYLLFILSLIFGNIITVIGAGVLFIARFIVQLSIINSSSKHFGERKYIFLLLVFDIILPVISLFILTFGRMGPKAKYIHWK